MWKGGSGGRKTKEQRSERKSWQNMACTACSDLHTHGHALMLTLEKKNVFCIQTGKRFIGNDWMSSHYIDRQRCVYGQQGHVIINVKVLYIFFSSVQGQRVSLKQSQCTTGQYNSIDTKAKDAVGFSQSNHLSVCAKYNNIYCCEFLPLIIRAILHFNIFHILLIDFCHISIRNWGFYII